MWQIAHRGVSNEFGDNNVISFTQAMIQNFDMVELDIQYSKDRDIIVYHDTDIEDTYVASFTTQELKSKGVITLDEFFNIIDIDKIRIFFDIKGQDTIIETLLTILQKRFSEQQMKRIYISGFNRHFVKTIVNTNLPINIGFTTENNFNYDIYTKIIKNLKFVCLHYNALNEETIDFLHKNDILVFSYTCKNNFTLQHMIKYKLDGIVTNFKI